MSRRSRSCGITGGWDSQTSSCSYPVSLSNQSKLSSPPSQTRTGGSGGWLTFTSPLNLQSKP